MKVLQINSVFGFGSTGRNTEELANFLTEKGHESFVAYAHGTSDYKNSFKYGYWLERKWHAVYFRLHGKQGLLSTYGTKKLIKYIRNINPDVIHLNSVHGNHLCFPLLFNFLSKNNYPIVWTLHDCWSFTGVCFHYTSEKCYKWKTVCNKECPHHHAILPEFGHDRVEEIYKLKKKHFTSIERMIIVPVSKWLEGEAKQSFLSKYHVEYIYNWIDLEKFKPVYEKIRTKYRIPEGKEIVLSVSAAWNKRSSKYRDALALYNLLPDDICMVIVGAVDRDTKFPENVIHIPYLNSTNDLAKIYSSAMVYVHLSVEDTFGKVIAEAMACGTPAVVFNSTAIPEIVGEGCGYVAEPHNIEQMLQYINMVKTKGKIHYSDKCLSRVTDCFNAETNMNNYLQIYKRLLG